jgi:hypothetical protein
MNWSNSGDGSAMVLSTVVFPFATVGKAPVYIGSPSAPNGLHHKAKVLYGIRDVLQYVLPADFPPLKSLAQLDYFKRAGGGTSPLDPCVSLLAW